jgi:hypothetical protein
VRPFRFRIRTIMLAIAALAVFMWLSRHSFWVEIDATGFWFVSDSITPQFLSHPPTTKTIYQRTKTQVPLAQVVVAATTLLALALYCRSKRQQRRKLRGSPMSAGTSSV